MLKLLLWRIVCKSLPVREILSKRFPILNISYPVCGEDVETAEHIFICCPIIVQASANLVWPLNMDVFKDINIDKWIKINIDKWIKIIINPREMLKIQGKKAKEFTLFVVVLCDQIWKNRNQTMWGNQLVDSSKLSIQINNVFIQHKQAWQSILGEKENSPSWKPPPLEWIKCNFDAALKPDKVVLAVVCRDSNGSIVVAQSVWLVKKVVLEGNAQSMIKAIPNPSTTPYWSINAIIEDIHVTLNSFVCWNASFVFKDSKGMFGNCFFSLFFVSKNNFLILRLKNLFGNLKWTKNKNCSQNSICEGN